MGFLFSQFDVFIQLYTCGTVHTCLESSYFICVCACAITRLAALWRLIQPCYLGGDPYGRSQSDVDGIAATLVLMRSCLALISDRMTERGGPHGSQPTRLKIRQNEKYRCSTITQTLCGTHTLSTQKSLNKKRTNSMNFKSKTSKVFSVRLTTISEKQI